MFAYFLNYIKINSLIFGRRTVKIGRHNEQVQFERIGTSCGYSFWEKRPLSCRLAINTGNYRYFNINLFSDLNKNPFIQDERLTDVDFGFLQEYTIYGNYTIPEGYSFEELPKNMSMIMPDTSIVFNRTIEADNNLLNVRITLEFQRTFYTSTEYPEFKEFYKKLFALLNEQIVIKKNP